MFKTIKAPKNVGRSAAPGGEEAVNGPYVELISHL